MAVTGYQPLAPAELAAQELSIDQGRGRRSCRVHREQQMIPLLPGMDVCPLCSEDKGPRPSAG